MTMGRLRTTKPSKGTPGTRGARGTYGTLGNPVRLPVPGGPKAREALEGANPALVVFVKPTGGIVVVVDPAM